MNTNSIEFNLILSDKKGNIKYIDVIFTVNGKLLVMTNKKPSKKIVNNCKSIINFFETKSSFQEIERLNKFLIENDFFDKGYDLYNSYLYHPPLFTCIGNTKIQLISKPK
jgi:hypothetical protein